MSFEVRAIREEEREECIRLWCVVFSEDGEAYFRRYFFGDVEWLPYYTRVGVLDGRLVSAVQICKRIVACGDFRLTMGGIANVATLPEYRRHGYNSQCLRSAITIMEADAMDFSTLGTGINHYYARQGYDTLPMPWLFGAIRSDLSPQPSTFTIRAAAGVDVPRIRAIYDRYNRTRPFTIHRTAAYWRDWIGISEAQVPANLKVAVDANDYVQGYIRAQLRHRDTPEGKKVSGVQVSEIGIEADGAEGECAQAMLQAVALEALALGGDELYAGLPLESAITAALESVLERVETRHTTGGMVRLLHRENLLRGFVLEWNDRWIAAGRPRGAVTCATPYGPTRLDANGDFLQIVSVDESAEVLPQATLFGLLFGMTSPEQATADTQIHPLLRTLFPPHAAIYYDSDGF